MLAVILKYYEIFRTTHFSSTCLPLCLLQIFGGQELVVLFDMAAAWLFFFGVVLLVVGYSSSLFMASLGYPAKYVCI
jgi:hypothetical protein